MNKVSGDMTDQRKMYNAELKKNRMAGKITGVGALTSMGASVPAFMMKGKKGLVAKAILGGGIGAMGVGAVKGYKSLRNMEIIDADRLYGRKK